MIAFRSCSLKPTLKPLSLGLTGVILLSYLSINHTISFLYISYFLNGTLIPAKNKRPKQH